MRLEEALLVVTEHGERAAVCAREPFSADSDACIVELDDSFVVPSTVLECGLKYFLGRGEIVRLMEHGTEMKLSREQAVELICHYAIFDAYSDGMKRSNRESGH